MESMEYYQFKSSYFNGLPKWALQKRRVHWESAGSPTICSNLNIYVFFPQYIHTPSELPVNSQWSPLGVRWESAGSPLGVHWESTWSPLGVGVLWESAGSLLGVCWEYDFRNPRNTFSSYFNWLDKWALQKSSPNELSKLRPGWSLLGVFWDSAWSPLGVYRESARSPC